MNTTFPWNIETGLKIIDNFQAINRPDFSDGNQDAYLFIIWNLYFRSFDAIKSSSLLIKNKKYYDAFIVSGHALEVCAILSYIIDNDKMMINQKRYRKYIARSTLLQLISNLEIEDDLISNPNLWESYQGLLKIFYPYGELIFRKGDFHTYQEVIEKLKYRLGSNQDKIHILKECFIQPIVQNYLNSFYQHATFIDKKLFSHYYNIYCSRKHTNFLSAGACDEDVSEEDGEYILQMLLGLISYLKKITPETFLINQEEK